MSVASSNPTKLCSRCKRILPIEEYDFNERSLTPGVRRCWCKRCVQRKKEIDESKSTIIHEDAHSTSSTPSTPSSSLPRNSKLLDANYDILNEIMEIIASKDRKSQLSIALKLEEFKDTL
jgi:hypothetical protein